MILKDRARDAFEDGFIEIYNNDQCSYLNLGYGMSIMEGFYRMPLSMQFGAYVDWFENNGITIEIDPVESQFSYCIYADEIFQENYFESRNEARVEALKKAGALYDEKVAQTSGRVSHFDDISL